MTDPRDAQLRQAQERIAALESTLRSYQIAIGQARVSLFLIDIPESGILEDSRLQMVNVAELLGYENLAAPVRLGETTAVTFHADDKRAFDDQLRECIAGTRNDVEIQVRALPRAGGEIWRLLRTTTVRDDQGRATRIIGMGIDITQLKTVERELRDATRVAELASRAKDEFLANVSHEIRTPMNAILGMTDLVLDSPLAEAQRRSLTTVRSAAAGLLDMINDLLDFSKIQAGQTALEEAPFGLRAALADTMTALASRAHRKGLELVYDVRGDVPDSLIGDVGRIRQIVLNLVGNAIKFTERGEVVVIVDLVDDPAAAPERVALRVAVRDTGIGIAEAKRAAIFRPFEQEDMSTTRRYGGTGLGLTIAARLAELMRGQIALESEPGRGSTFTATMVLARGPATEPRAVAGADLRGVPVLVVDDNAVNRDILESWLRASQLVPTLVGDGIAAMDALWHAVASGVPYPIILLDARMPDTDGVALATKIRERNELAASRIIVLSSGERPDERERFRALGVEAQLRKPVPHEELIDAIRAVMARPAD